MKYSDVPTNITITSQNLENIFNIYQDEDGFYFFNLSKSIYFPEDLDGTYYSQYSTKPKDTYPLIAYNYYGSVRLWWLICAVNSIDNPVKQPEPGTLLKILNPSVARTVLMDLNLSS